MAGICEECGCVCARCTKPEPKHSDMHLHAEIENLRQRLMERDSHIVTMETQFLNEADKFPNGELASLKEELRIWQEKYSRLYEAHKRVQKVNQNLEDKLLRIVDKCETEKGAFAKDIATLSHRLADANYTIHRLTQDNEKYRNDVNLAIQLLQCKPSNFVGQKYDSLPSEVQAKVRTYVAQKRRSSDASPPDVKSITVPISTFPPTAMVYNITKANVEKHSDDESGDDSKPPVDVVSAAIMAKVLEDRERERIFAKHCDTCTCHRTIVTVDSETQTTLDRFDVRVCDDCGSTELRNDINAYDSLNGAINNSQSSSDGLGLAVNFGRAVDAQGATNRGSRMENSHLENCANASAKFYGSHQYLTKQKLTQSPSERTALAKANINKIKQSRLSKRLEASAEPARNAVSLDHWSKCESDATPDNRADDKTTETITSHKDPSPVDIINDRIWKSGWSNAKSQLNAPNDRIDNRQRGSGGGSADTRIDVINDRVWRNDASSSFGANRAQPQMTLIEVTNAVNAASPRGGRGHAESAASPSFSSDSVVISTSNQSSSSSDALHATTNDSAKRSLNRSSSSNNNNINNINNSGSKSGWKDRAAGPRNCFMRVTPGSKNILLDNVGHYQTVLYTSGTNRPNTALVHVAKSTRSGRSMSTSSEENSPIVTTTSTTTDNTQLQRVAEWVQSSVGVSKTPGAVNSREKTTSRQQTPLIAPSAVDEEATAEETLVKIDIDDGAESTSALLADNSNLREVVVRPISPKTLDNPFDADARSVEETTDRGMAMTNDVSRGELTEDLITFDTCNDARSRHNSVTTAERTDGNYEVKITKEMEEIYLKLAASLDPVSLRLASPSSSADLTIEKYRKDHRSRIHVQKLQDKPKQ